MRGNYIRTNPYEPPLVVIRLIVVYIAVFVNKIAYSYQTFTNI